MAKVLSNCEKRMKFAIMFFAKHGNFLSGVDIAKNV